MDILEVWHIVKDSFIELLIAGIIIGTLILGIFILASDKFRGTTDLLILQSATGERDLYSLSKSAEYVSNVLSDAMYSNLFIEEMVKLHRFDPTIFPMDQKEQLKAWNKMAKVSKNFQSNILTLQVKGDDPLIVLSISKAAAQVLMEKNYLFRTGSPESVTIKILSGPIMDRNPSVFGIIVVGLGGFVVGVLLMSLLTLNRPRRLRHDEASNRLAYT